MGAAHPVGEASKRNEAVLVRRPIRNPSRPLVTLKDFAVLLWLGCGVLAAPLPRAFRLKLCAFAALFASRSRRAADARRRLTQIGLIAEPRASEIVRELYAGRLASYLDVVRNLLIGPDIRAVCEGMQHLEAALAHGRGAVLWVSDFVSAGDVSKIMLAKAGYLASHLSRPEHGFTTSEFGIRYLNPLRIRFERAYLAERVIFDRTKPTPAVSRLMRVLRANGIVSIMVSIHEGGMLAEVPFLAGRLRVALGALRIGGASGAPVIPLSVLRDRDRPDTFALVFSAPLKFPNESREGDLLAAAHEYALHLGALVRERPESWVGWRRADQLSGPA